MMVCASQGWMCSDSVALAALILRHLRQGDASARWAACMVESTALSFLLHQLAAGWKNVTNDI